MYKLLSKWKIGIYVVLIHVLKGNCYVVDLSSPVRVSSRGPALAKSSCRSIETRPWSPPSDYPDDDNNIYLVSTYSSSRPSAHTGQGTDLVRAVQAQVHTSLVVGQDSSPRLTCHPCSGQTGYLVPLIMIEPCYYKLGQTNGARHYG